MDATNTSTQSTEELVMICQYDSYYDRVVIGKVEDEFLQKGGMIQVCLEDKKNGTKDGIVVGILIRSANSFFTRELEMPFCRGCAIPLSEILERFLEGYPQSFNAKLVHQIKETFEDWEKVVVEWESS